MRFMMLTGLMAILAICAAGQNRITEIAGLDGMAGCWERRDASKKLLVSEQWMKPAGTSILGMGRTVRDSKTTDYEFMRIERRDDGLYFIARPKANTDETAFKMISSTLNEVVFENKDHDFPQRVIYRFRATEMTGRIEGTEGGKFLGIDFPMKRVKCG